MKREPGRKYEDVKDGVRRILEKPVVRPVIIESVEVVIEAGMGSEGEEDVGGGGEGLNRAVGTCAGCEVVKGEECGIVVEVAVDISCDVSCAIGVGDVVESVETGRGSVSSCMLRGVRDRFGTAVAIESSAVYDCVIFSESYAHRLSEV